MVESPQTPPRRPVEDTSPGSGSQTSLPIRWLTRDTIATDPNFFAAQQAVAAMLLDVQAQTPRIARHMASHRRWLVSQTSFALAMRAKMEPGAPELTPGRLLAALTPHVEINRKTLSQYLGEMEAHGLLAPPGEYKGDGRLRPVTTTPLAEQGMRRWCEGHLHCLDILDGGARLDAARRDPDLAFAMQRQMVEIIRVDPEWHAPPAAMAHFLGSDTGGMMLHALTRMLRDLRETDGRIYLERVSIADFAAQFLISVSKIKRMVQKAEEAGNLGWEEPRRRGRLWLSPDFIRAHFRRQAVKFEAVERAYRAVA
ncbi:hypothetical protein [Thioclava sp. IC9]|uniref:hypothetical protein n=1 Tax=Thioclava sp. IC9 TaxID=1973007 RepID=UPI0011310118|nr:hypothetical protein [Thioclava sp. IC9]